MSGYLARASVARALKAATIAKSPRWGEANHAHAPSGGADMMHGATLTIGNHPEAAADAMT